jgi:hypothetical protein
MQLSCLPDIYAAGCRTKRESQDLRSIDELPDLQFQEALHLVLLQFAVLVQKTLTKRAGRPTDAGFISTGTAILIV